MNVGALQPDTGSELPSIAPLASPAAPPADVQLFHGMAQAFAGAGESLARAQRAEAAFAAGSGGLQEMVFERARADAILNVAAAGATKATQSLNTVLNMQV